MRRREIAIDQEELPQAAVKNAERLHIVIWPIDVSVPVIEVDVCHHKSTAFFQKLSDLRQLLLLCGAYVLKYALRYDDVKAFAMKPDGVLDKVRFNKIRCRLLNGYIDSVIMNVGGKKRHQGCRTASYVQKIALPTIRDLVG